MYPEVVPAGSLAKMQLLLNQVVAFAILGEGTVPESKGLTGRTLQYEGYGMSSEILHYIWFIKNSTMEKYILEGKKPVREHDILKWAAWYEKADRVVKSTVLPGNVRVSTVFLGLDHAFGFRSSEPILFETMIFGGDHDGYQERYGTWEQAEAGHEEATKLVFA